MGFIAAIPAAMSTLMTASTATAAQVTAAATTMAEATAAVSAASAAYAGYTQYQQNSFQAKVAEQNAKIAQQNEQSVLTQGTAAESASREQTTQRVGAALAAQGANGLDVGYGTSEGVREGIQNTGDIDALTIRYNAAQRAMGYAVQGLDFESQASGYRAAADKSLIAAGINVGSSFLSGASSIANIKMMQGLYGVAKSSAPGG